MALGFLDRCVFTAAGAGTGNFVVSAAVTGYLTPAQASAVNGTTYRYFAQSDDLSEWEVGYGAYTSATTTLARTTIEFSSNSNNAVNFSAAPKVYMGGPLAMDMPAWVRLDGGSVGTTKTIDMDLPTDYQKFRLEIIGLTNDTYNFIYYGFSDDAGDTFKTGAGFYSHRMAGGKNTAGSQTALSWKGTDVLGLLTINGTTAGEISLTSLISPGDTGKNPHIHSQVIYTDVDDAFTSPETISSVLVGATGRMNFLRLTILGNADIDPPTGTDQFTGGYWVLEGLR